MARLVGGQWLLLEHQDPIGYERWRARAEPSGARTLESEGGATFPQPHETRVRAVARADGELERLEVETRVEGEDGPRALTASWAAPGLLLVERRVAGKSEEELVPLGPREFLDYTSPLLTTMMLRRLALDVGGERELGAVLISPLTLALSRQMYAFTRLPDERVRTAAGEFEARKYRYSSLSTRFTGHVWTDEDENVLKYEGSWDLVEAVEA